MANNTYIDRVYFGKTDYVLLSIMLGISLAIGVFFAVSGNRQRTKIDYLLGNRRLGALPVCLSLFATFQSAISLLGIPAEVYTYGTMTIYSFIGILLSYLLATITLVPLIYPLKITSVYEYLELRFQSRGVRLLGTFFGVISSISYMTIALLSPALALQAAVGIPLWMSIVIVGIAGTTYTAIGGIKSVIWTDVFQTCIILGGIVFILIKGSLDVGGFSKVWQVASENGRTIFDDFRPDLRIRHTFWGLSLGGTIYWAAANFSQSSVQRISATKSMKSARIVFAVATPLVMVYGIVLLLSGLVLLAYFFESGCDPIRAKYLSNRNQLMPYFVMHTLGFLPGLPGLYISTVFSGALSTLSSGINSLAANTIEDFLGPRLANTRDSTVTFITKIIVIVYGLAVIGLANLVKEFSGPVTQMTYTALGATSGPVLGLFVLGATFPQANAVGAASGCVCGLIASIWINVGSFLYGSRTPMLSAGPTDRCTGYNSSHVVEDMQGWYTEAPRSSINLTGTLMPFTTQSLPLDTSEEKGFTLYDLSYVWIPLVGVLVTLIVGLLVSAVTNRFKTSKNSVGRHLYFPFARRLWCLPEENNDFTTYDLHLQVAN